MKTTWNYVWNSASEVWPQEVSKLTLGAVLSLLVELWTLINSQTLASRLGWVFEDIASFTFVTDCSFGLDITVGHLHLTTLVVHEIVGWVGTLKTSGWVGVNLAVFDQWVWRSWSENITSALVQVDRCGGVVTLGALSVLVFDTIFDHAWISDTKSILIR